MLDRLVAGQPAARRADRLRHRPAGPRCALRDRRVQARARARLARAGELRERHRQDGPLVSRQRMVVAAAARALCRRAARPARTGARAERDADRRHRQRTGRSSRSLVERGAAAGHEIVAARPARARPRRRCRRDRRGDRGGAARRRSCRPPPIPRSTRPRASATWPSRSMATAPAAVAEAAAARSACR